MKIILATLVAVVLAQASQGSVQATENSPGWLVYSRPSHDDAYGEIKGQARHFAGGWLRAGNPSIVDVSDQAGDSVSVHFFKNSSAKDFLAAIQSGASYDLSACAHRGRLASSSGSSSLYGCTDSVYEADFHCDLLDSVPSIDASTIDADRYLNPKELSVYLTERECFQGG